jgi:chromosome segregation ATPase
MNERPSLADQKLMLEIEQMRRPWWKKPAFLAAYLPAVITLGTLWFNYELRDLRRSMETVGMALDEAKQELAQVQERKTALVNEVRAASTALADAHSRLDGFMTEANRFKDQFEIVRTDEGEFRYQTLENKLSATLGLIRTTQDKLEALTASEGE